MAGGFSDRVADEAHTLFQSRAARRGGCRRSSVSDELPPLVPLTDTAITSSRRLLREDRAFQRRDNGAGNDMPLGSPGQRTTYPILIRARSRSPGLRNLSRKNHSVSLIRIP